MVTIIDIAKKAGVSKSTVSRVLTGQSKRGDTIEKVYKAAKELNYMPNRMAQAMITKRTGIIGVIIYRKHMPIISHPFYGSILDAIASEIKRFGYSIIIIADDELTSSTSEQLMGYQVDGLILMSRVTKELIQSIQVSGVPFVLINNSVICENTTYVVNDDYLGGYDAALHLIDKGYSNIAYISGPLEHRSYRLRWEGFQAALAVKNVELDPYLRYIGDSTIDTGIEGVSRFLQQKNKPDAIFSSNDMMAIGAMQMLHSMNLSIPEDVAVIGFDDIPFASLTFPPLTTIKVDKERMGKIAIKKLVGMIEGKVNNPGKTILPPQLIVREST